MKKLCTYKINICLESAVQEDVHESGAEDDMEGEKEIVEEKQEPEGESGPTGITQVEAPPETPTTDVSEVPADSDVVDQEIVEGYIGVFLLIVVSCKTL